jgi:hypothetical protein
MLQTLMQTQIYLASTFSQEKNLQGKKCYKHHIKNRFAKNILCSQVLSESGSFECYQQ